MRHQLMPASPNSTSKLTKHAITIGVALAFVFGLVVPAVVLTNNGESKASTADGVHLSSQEVKGRELFAHTCAVCHSLAAVNAIERTGPNLDVRVGDDLTTPLLRRELVLSAIKEGRALGRGNMPALLYQGKEAEDVADFVAAVAGH